MEEFVDEMKVGGRIFVREVNADWKVDCLEVTVDICADVTVGDTDGCGEEERNESWDELRPENNSSNVHVC